MSERKDKKLLDDRDKRMVGYIKSRLSAAEIAKREGIQPDYAMKQRKRVAVENGLTIQGPKSGDMPYGLDNESRRLRGRLGDKLWYLQSKLKMEQLEIAQRVGIPRKLQKKAMEKPNAYNWTLAEMQQLAKALGVSFEALMVDLTTERPDGTV